VVMIEAMACGTPVIAFEQAEVDAGHAWPSRREANETKRPGLTERQELCLSQATLCAHHLNSRGRNEGTRLQRAA
jgi:hypothetical protein